MTYKKELLWQRKIKKYESQYCTSHCACIYVTSLSSFLFKLMLQLTRPLPTVLQLKIHYRLLDWSPVIGNIYEMCFLQSITICRIVKYSRIYYTLTHGNIKVPGKRDDLNVVQPLVHSCPSSQLNLGCCRSLGEVEADRAQSITSFNRRERGFPSQLGFPFALRYADLQREGWDGEQNERASSNIS